MGNRVSMYLTQERVWDKVKSVKVRLHVATTWFERPCCPLVYVRYCAQPKKVCSKKVKAIIIPLL
jgi:hypothetical protein